MFLYRFCTSAADSSSHDNFWTTFAISFIFGTIVGPDLQITWLDFGRFRCDLDLEFPRSNMELAISQQKMVQLPRNDKQTHRLNSRPLMWPSGLTLAMTLTLNFQGQIWNLLYLSQKWCDCYKAKSKHIDWSQGLKCDHRVRLWTWPWPWIFKVKTGICYISAKNGGIVMKGRANISIDPKASNVTIGFDLDFSRSNMELAISLPKMVWLPRNEKQTYWLISRPQMRPSG